MGHTACNWQDDARRDEPQLTVQDAPGASARACAQQHISSATKMQEVGTVVRRRLASWVPRLRHGPAARAERTPPEAEDGLVSPNAGQHAFQNHAVNSDDARSANFLGNAGLLDPVAETNTPAQSRLLAVLGEAQGTDREHQIWRRRCGECEGLMNCYFGIDECHCRERGNKDI